MQMAHHIHAIQEDLAAAASLARLGDDGVSTVKRAAHTHPDQAAREMAVQILLEANLLDPATARLAKGVA